MHELSLIVQFHKPNVLFLIETKTFHLKLNRLKYSLGFQCLFSVDGIGRSGGLAQLWKEDFPLNIHTFSNRLNNYWINNPLSSKT